MAVNGSCYSLNGALSPYDGTTYVPCNHTALALGEHSACCAPGDKCLSNGLCQYNNQSATTGGAIVRRPYNEWWRVACTDPTFSDPSCPNYCDDIERNVHSSHLAFQCDNVNANSQTVSKDGGSNWCCATGDVSTYSDSGTVNTTCCSITDLMFDTEDAVVYTTAESWTVTATSTSISSTQTVGGGDATTGVSASGVQTSATITTGAAEATASTSSTAGAKSADDGGGGDSTYHDLALGLGFGIGIPLATLLILACIFMFRRLRSSSSHASTPSRINTGLSGYQKQPLSPATTTPSTLTPSSTHIPRPGRTWFPGFRHRRRPSQYEPFGPESNEDLRHTHPHAFHHEAAGKEMAVEMDADRREPVELFSPIEGQKYFQGDADRYR